jgi:hypothetical protein
VFASELYDHREDQGTDFDLFENVNLLANNSAPLPRGSPVAEAVAELRPVLTTQFQHDGP